MAADEQREVLMFMRDLIRATEAGEVEWEQAGPHAFYVATGGGVVRVESLSEQQDHPFVVRIYDGEERLMYELRTEFAHFYNEPEVLAADLYEAARLSIFDVGGTIKRIRHSLGI